MSNPFSYELDERQIRLILQNGEMEHDPLAWDKVEQAMQSQPKSVSHSFTPKLNLSISRSVIVPVIFIALIGGLSVMLFSFVDFKKKEEVRKDPVLQASKERVRIKSWATGTTPSQKESAKTPVVNQQEIGIASTTTASNTPLKKEEIMVPEAETKVPETKAPVADRTLTLSANRKKETTRVIRSPRRKTVSEEIPTINASSTKLNSGNAEPELKLR